MNDAGNSFNQDQKVAFFSLLRSGRNFLFQKCIQSDEESVYFT